MPPDPLDGPREHRVPRPIARTAAIAVLVGAITTALTAFTGTCYLPISQAISEAVADQPEPIGVARFCEHGAPRQYLLEDRLSDLRIPDDSSRSIQVFLAPAFRETSIDEAAVASNIVTWTLTAGAFQWLMGPHLSSRRARRLLLPSALLAGISTLLVVSGPPTTIGGFARADSVAGWPVSWIVYNQGYQPILPLFVDLRSLDVLRGLINVAVWWSATAFTASWIPPSHPDA